MSESDVDTLPAANVTDVAASSRSDILAVAVDFLPQSATVNARLIENLDEPTSPGG